MIAGEESLPQNTLLKLVEEAESIKKKALLEEKRRAQNLLIDRANHLYEQFKIDIKAQCENAARQGDRQFKKYFNESEIAHLLQSKIDNWRLTNEWAIENNIQCSLVYCRELDMGDSAAPAKTVDYVITLSW